MLSPGLDLQFNIKNLQLYRTINLEYIREISGTDYEIEKLE